MSFDSRLYLIPIIDFKFRNETLWAKITDTKMFSVVIEKESHKYPYVVDYVDDCIALRSTQDNRKPLVIDLNKARRKIGKGDLLTKAIGNKSKVVIDATAGLGKDSVHIASSGKTVIMIERDPVISLLLQDGFRRLISSSIRQRLQLHSVDSMSILGCIRADAVYIDPMFETTHKTALPGRELQYLRDVLSVDYDSADLLQLARHHYSRVIVKRGDKAKPIMDDVTQAFSGNTIRYDVYINTTINSKIR